MNHSMRSRRLRFIDLLPGEDVTGGRQTRDLKIPRSGNLSLILHTRPPLGNYQIISQGGLLLPCSECGGTHKELLTDLEEFVAESAKDARLVANPTGLRSRSQIADYCIGLRRSSCISFASILTGRRFVRRA